jgi:glycosyltransferase involved in cell wall biosynthesis
MELVSVVIPLYNKATHVGRAVRSVLCQTHPAFELIVVDDGSTDGGAAVVEGTGDPRVRLIRQANEGVSAARNRGISAAKSKWIAFLDADDEWLPEFLDEVLRARLQCPTAKMIGASFSLVYDKGGAKRRDLSGVREEVGLIKNWFEAAFEKNPICASSVLIKKEVFDHLGGFPEGLPRGEDDFMWCKIALEYDVALVKKWLVVVYKNAVNRSSSLQEVYDFPVLEYIKERGVRLDPEKAYSVERFVYKKCLANAKKATILGQYQRARELVGEAKGTRAFRSKRLKLAGLLMLPDQIIAIIVKSWRRLGRGA